ncbi:hypothetical protein GGQ68_002418 [Sagittula marina]|uniref:Uncharacterized protein n=1 Tax=Sagittula marina TaxID=943940 RepID=A0A7W6DMZ8_9RHOB|nr:hypothetical protein [Sagittula marina]MBB3986080.1 hypothetical protein [Sagittula marina]
MSIDDTTLQNVLTSGSDLSQASLATKILVSRLRVDVASQPADLATALSELKSFIAKYPFAQQDLRAL